MTETMTDPCGCSGSDIGPDGSVSDSAVKTWRYLRLSMVGLVVGLGVSVLYEHFKTKDNCWETSISAYYYTPVHAFFVGALVTIGVCLVSLKGNTEWEDILLNFAGICAPVVALVPTPNAPTSCGSVLTDTTDRDLNVGNNVVAYFSLGALALIILAGLTVKSIVDGDEDAPSLKARLGYAAAGVLLIVAIVVFEGPRKWFTAWAHPISAISMFVFIWINVMVNAHNLREAFKDSPHPKGFFNRYSRIAILMVVAAAVTGGFGLGGWSQWIFGIEASLITLFAIFWVIQTNELWKYGLRPPVGVLA